MLQFICFYKIKQFETKIPNKWEIKTLGHWECGQSKCFHKNEGDVKIA